MEIPWRDLAAETLRAVIEEYVTREGTDYGEREVPLDQKVAQVTGQLESGTAVLTFDAATGTVSIEQRERP